MKQNFVKILTVVAFIIATFSFFAYFLVASENKAIAYSVWICILLIDLLIAFIYKHITKSRILLTIAVAQIVIFLVYLLIAAVL